MPVCDMCLETSSEEDTFHNPRIGVDHEIGDWIYDYDTQLCSTCWDTYCVKNDLGTLEEALAEGVEITFFPSN